MIETRSIKARILRAELSVVEPTEGATPSHDIDLVWSTGFKGMRSEWGEKFYEELDMSANAVDLSRLSKGAPLLAQHDSTVASVIGVVRKAYIQDGIGYATVRLSKRKDVEGIVQDVLEGILRNVSVGYQVTEFTDVTRSGDKVRTLKATKWQPQEISIVAIGFDPNAQTLRSAGSQNENEVQIINPNSESQLTDEEKQKLAEASATATEAVRTEVERAPAAVEKTAEEVAAEAKAKQDEEKQKIEAAERKAIADYVKRSAEIKAAVRAAKLPDELAEDLVNRGLTSAEASTEIFKQLQIENEKTISGTVRKETMTKRELAEAALLNRLDARNHKVDQSNPYKQQTLLTIAEAVVDRNPGESDASFAKRAISSSTLAELLSNTANKILSKDGPEAYSYTKIAEQVQLSDFKSTPIVKLSMSGLTAKSAETDDYTDTAMVDTGENMQLVDRGALFKISYTALMNDDLGAFSKLPQKAAMLGARDIEAQLYALLNANAAMSDTVALFHTATHANNIAAGVGPTVAGLDAAQQLMSAFQDGSSNPIDLSIKYIIVPPSLALVAKQTVGAITASSATNVNPFGGGEIEVIVSSRIAQVSAKDAWFAVCDPNVWSALVVGTLQGQGDQPEVSAEEDFNSKNLKIRVSQPSDVAAASYKGIVRTVLA